MPETKIDTRQQIATRRASDFERYHTYLQTERETQPENALKSAEHFIDRFTIEQRAANLIENHQKKESILPPAEYLNNARTALFEALTASGHLSRIELEGTLEEVNQQVLERLLNGYSDDLPLHERQRRFMELCEELTVQEVQAKIISGELPPDVEVLTLSDYPYSLSDKQAMSLGYNPYNRKGMVRTNGLQMCGGKVTRVIEQLSRSNADPHETVSFLQQQNINIPQAGSPDVAVIATQTLFSRHDFADGVVDIQRRLDRFVGKNIMYGETPDEATITYERVREISALREARIEVFAKELARYEEYLDKQVMNGNLNHVAADTAYMQKVRDLVRQICVLDPRYTKHALGEAVEAAYFEASKRMANGDTGGAAELVATSSDKENAIVICGMTSAVEQLSSAQQDSFKQALEKKQKLQMLRPKHADDKYYLMQKWGKEDVSKGVCIACDNKRWVAKCSICPECDYEDTKKPGYVENLLNRKKNPSLFKLIIETMASTEKKAPAKV